MSTDRHIVDSRAIEHLMSFLRIEGLSGDEGRVAQEVRRRLLAAGCPRAAILEDDAARRLGGRFRQGNLIVRLPGTRRGPRRLFLGHMDTVPLCRGAVPVRRGNRIVARGASAVRADNRTAVAALVTAAEALLRSGTDHGPITLLFTIGEEIGLYGAKAVRPSDLGRPAIGFNLDAGDPARVIVGAIGASRWTAVVRGRSSHAGMWPERGVSAMLAAARAIERAAAEGWFGKIERRRGRGTANAGIIAGGEATNQVTDRVDVHGECRSHSAAFLRRIVAAWRRAFERAAASVRNVQGDRASVEFSERSDYRAFRLSRSHPAVRTAIRAVRAIGLSPVTEVVNGGLDANPLVEKGIPTVTLGAGQHNAHSVEEYVELSEYLAGCRLVFELMRQPG
ncbi:MAG: M20/M25/M40 family metallo-hydrolase [Kiritimatiellae bacterium]|nr:M20/M25/M40 family metallo-hydrolase [Kiritimatiellia bacterium]